jgi:hypothetical protein
MKKSFLGIMVFAAFVLIMTTPSCYYDVESQIYPTTGTTTCDTTSATFAAFVSPLISSNCATSGCHSAASSAAGVNLGTYTAIKSYITSSKTTFFGTINQTSGYSAMPKGGSKFTACNITKLNNWVTAGMLNN